MVYTLKPLTAFITREGNIADIVIKDERGLVILTVPHRELHTKINPEEAINDRLVQLKMAGLNIVAVETTMPGVVLR